MDRYLNVPAKYWDRFCAVLKQVQKYRHQYGDEICTDVEVDGEVATYTFMPDDVTGYTVEVNLATGESRHCGNGTGCFWTEWEGGYVQG